MHKKRHIPGVFGRTLLGVVFGAILAGGLLFPVTLGANSAYADEEEQMVVVNQEEQPEKPEEEGENSENQPENAENPENTEQNQQGEQKKVAGNNCTNQTGAVGWLICPVTGVVANAADALYSVIENLLVIDPVSFNSSSPVYNIWDYCRGVTNLVFAIIILIVIYSQITGIGFSNYNLKKTLPRIIVAAILINLSFIICAWLVDLSNIVGSSLRGMFEGIIENTVVASGFDTAEYTLENITKIVVGGGALAAGAITVTVVAAGGAVAFFWMLVPVLLGALVSIVTGFLTISLRQAVVVLLVMIAPLAIVANALPNTEKWFTKWKSMLMQMLVFYPVFSFLFGASRLVGLIFITSATNIYGVILGIAVQIFPLFFSWHLMKMSGTVLGGINAKMVSIGQRPVGRARAWSASHQAVAKARHNALSSLPSARLARFMEDRQARRNSDLARYQEAAKRRGEAYAANVYRRGRLTRRGEGLYRLEGEDLNNAATAKRLKAELTEAGYRSDGTDNRIRGTAQRARIAAMNKNIVQGVDRVHASDSFLESAKTANASSYAQRTEKIREEVIRIRNDNTLTEAQKAAQMDAVDANMKETLSSITDPETRTQYMNNVFANAISAQSKADKVTRDNYAQLYASTQLTRNIHADFNKSFADKNYNALEAAIDELAKRGDFDLIKESLEQHSGEIIDNVEMQKHLADTLIKYKADSAPLWAYAKATNIRRAKHAANPDKVALFATFEEFERGITPHTTPNEDAETTDSLSMVRLVKEINNPSIATSQDRTTFKYLLQSQQKGILSAKDMGFQVKQLRSAASSGQIDGEQLANLNLLITGGIQLDGNGQLDTKKMKPEAIAYVQQNGEQIKRNILDYVENMSAGQLASMKESTFIAFNNALGYLMGDRRDYGTGMAGGLSETFYNAAYLNAASNMNNILKSNMNTNVKKWLGIKNNKQ